MTYLAFRIVSTVFLGISILLTFPKHASLFDPQYEQGPYFLAMLWSLGWRATVIVCLWVI